MSEEYSGKNILITGGLGSIGSELVRQLSEYASNIMVIDNRETEMYNTILDNNDKNNLTFVYADIRDKDRLLRITEKIDIIFHTAAMKHVIICEYNPFEALKTNVIGTENIIECALKNNISKMILVSTDKAVNPTNVMGATKLLAERLVSAAHYHASNDTKFGIVRLGNILASRGSVLETWNNQLLKGEKITITDRSMTRFFMSIPESVRMILDTAKYAEKGETFIFKMSAVRIGDLADAFLELKGYPTDHYRIIGSGAGEKVHEELISDSETRLLLESEKVFVRLPIDFDNSDRERFSKRGFQETEKKVFRSNIRLLEKDAIKRILLESKII